MTLSFVLPRSGTRHVAVPDASALCFSQLDGGFFVRLPWMQRVCVDDHPRGLETRSLCHSQLRGFTEPEGGQSCSSEPLRFLCAGFILEP